MDWDKIRKFLVELRKENGLTQQQLSEKLYTSRENISKWERGVNNPSTEMLIDLSKIYNVSVKELLAGERKTETNEEKINNMAVEVLKDSHTRIKKILTTFIILASYQEYVTNIMRHERNYEAEFKNVTYGEAKEIAKDSNVKEISVMQVFGESADLTPNSILTYKINVSGFDENSIKNCHIELVEGRFPQNDKEILLIDIPGTYSLMSNSQEEEIARDYICFEKPDVMVVVVDATCLERNLNLVYQTMEITDNVVVCVNLLDEAEKKGIVIDTEKLSNLLGVPVVGTIARKKKTLKKLTEAINNVALGLTNPKPIKIKYAPIIEESIVMVEEILKKKLENVDNNLKRWISLKLIDGNEKIITSIENHLKIDLKSDKELALKLNEIKILLLKNNINENNFRDNIVSSIIEEAEKINKKVCKYKSENYNERDRKIDKILTSKKYGIPIMLLFLGVIFWLTITGANYPSELLSNFFNFLQDKLYILFERINAPDWLTGILVTGMFQTTGWVISVMLPPMMIFFPLFTLLEDLGYLPRIAFNLDGCFKKCCGTGKQALTMCMGFGCNAAGVVGCRIIDSPRERLIAILTNVFVPCNGRFPFLITIAMIFIGSYFTGIYKSIISTLVVLLVILLGIILTLVISKILSKTILKGIPSSFILELPPYRKPQIGKILIRSIFDRTIFVLGRAISVAAPVGIVIWLFANLTIGDLSILTYIANFLEPFAKLIGLDGYILTAFILGIPANEIVLPIILMSYMSTGALVNLEDTYSIGQILIQNGWTILTAINVMIFTLLHFPCGTTLLTIKKETKSAKWTIISFLLPTICGMILCFITTFIYNVINVLI